MPVPPQTKQISDVVWEIPTSYKAGMNVPARIYATKKLLDGMDQGVFEQVTNVASLPGIVKLLLRDGRRPLGLWLPHRRRGGV